MSACARGRRRSSLRSLRPAGSRHPRRLRSSSPLIVFALVAVPLNLTELRRRKLSAPLLAMFRKVTPKLSATEQIALEAGTVGFEGELFSGKPDWKKLLRAAEARAFGRRAGVPRRPGRRALPHDRRLGNHARTRRSAAGDLGFPQEEEILRHDHPEGIRRPRLLGAGAFGRAAEDGRHVDDAGVDGRGAEFARAGRTARALRHAGTEGSISAAPRRRTRSAVLRADRSVCRLRRDVDPRLRHRLQGRMERRERRRREADVRQALHHARAGRDDRRPRVPHARSGQAARRRRGSRHHARAVAARDARASRSAAGISR